MRNVWTTLTVGLWVLAIALRVHNALSYPLDGTADARLGHLAYITQVKETWRQPPIKTNWETWQPPLYHWTSAALWTLVAPASSQPESIFALPQRAVIPLYSSLLGLLAAAVVAGAVRRLLPADPLARVLALALVLFWPMHLILAPFVRNDLLSVLLTTFVVAWLVRQPSLTSIRPRAAVGLGALAGLGLLAKYTGVAVLVTLAGTLTLAALGDRSRWRATLGTLATIFAVAVVIAGGFYARNCLEHGHLFVTPVDWLGGFFHPPGFRTLGSYLWFSPSVFVHPWVIHPDVIHSVWAGTYASAWFDGQFIFLVHYMSPAVAEIAGRVLLPLGLLPTLAMLLGAARATLLTVRERSLLPFGPLIIVAAWSVVGYIHLNMLAPYYSTVKAHYLMPAVLSWTTFFAVGVATGPRWFRALVAVDMILLVGVASAVFCFGLIR